MNIRYHFRHRKSALELSLIANTKLAKLSPLLLNEKGGVVSFDYEGNKHKVRLSFIALDRSAVEVVVFSKNMYESINKAIEKMSGVLYRRKEKFLKRRASVTARDLDARAARRETDERSKVFTIDAEDVIARSA